MRYLLVIPHYSFLLPSIKTQYFKRELLKYLQLVLPGVDCSVIGSSQISDIQSSRLCSPNLTQFWELRAVEHEFLRSLLSLIAAYTNINRQVNCLALTKAR